MDDESPKTRFLQAIRPTGLILLISAMLLALGLWFYFSYGVTVGELTRDPTRLGGLPAYFGLLSQIGIFFWAGTVSVCFLAAASLSETLAPERARAFFLVSGIFSLYLGLDDAFLFHDALFPYLGIREIWTIAAYVIGTAVYGYYFFRVIRATEYPLLLLALLCFSISVALDLVQPRTINPYLLEDSAKLTGLVAWFVYFYRTSRNAISDQHHHNPKRDA